MCDARCFLLFFFFNDTATTEIYTLSLHDALPISDHLVERPPVHRVSAVARLETHVRRLRREQTFGNRHDRRTGRHQLPRSEEHTSELQSRLHLVCRLLLEKKKKKIKTNDAAYHQ